MRLLIMLYQPLMIVANFVTSNCKLKYTLSSYWSFFFILNAHKNSKTGEMSSKTSH